MKKTLTDILQNSDSQLTQLLVNLFESLGEIGQVLRHTDVHNVGTSNRFGDEQLNVDMACEKIISQRLTSLACVYATASEENPTFQLQHNDGAFIVCWDPLDGSSIINSNFAVGSIIGVWAADKSCSLGVSSLGETGRANIKASIMATHGSRATAVLAIDGVAYDLLLSKENCWSVTETVNIKPDNCSIFSPANLRCTQELNWYNNLILFYMKNKYTLRYTGGMVPDVYQIMKKQTGIFINPVSDGSPAKLRLLFEAVPIAHIIESAGGAAKTVDPNPLDILDVAINNVDQRTSFVAGSKTEVIRVGQYVAE